MKSKVNRTQQSTPITQAVNSIALIKSFDGAAYNKQCYSIASAYKNVLANDFSDESYQAYNELIGQCPDIAKSAIGKIELAVTTLGSKARPIDYVCF